MLADAEVQDPAVRAAGELLGLAVVGQERRLALGCRVVRLGEVGRAAPQLGQHRRDRGEHVAGRLAGRHALLVGGELGQRRRPAVGQLARRHAVEQRLAVRVGRCPGVERLLPLGVCRAARARRPRGRARARRRRPRRCVDVSKPSSRFVAATSSAPSAEPCALPVFCALGAGQRDDRAQRDERRPVGDRQRGVVGVGERLHVLVVRAVVVEPVDALHVPAERLRSARPRPRRGRCRCRPRSRCGCRRRAGSRLPSRCTAAIEDASLLTPSSMSPSEAITQTLWSNGLSPSAASGSSRPRSRRAAMAMPTALPTPWPSGPVVVSTPAVCPCSG